MEKWRKEKIPAIRNTLISVWGIVCYSRIPWIISRFFFKTNDFQYSSSWRVFHPKNIIYASETWHKQICVINSWYYRSNHMSLFFWTAYLRRTHNNSRKNYTNNNNDMLARALHFPLSIHLRPLFCISSTWWFKSNAELVKVLIQCHSLIAKMTF